METKTKEKITKIEEELKEIGGLVLFVCSGNIMRSPFAEYRARQLAKQKGMKKVDFSSGGVVYRNTSLSSETYRYLMSYGVKHEEMTNFKPRHISDYPELYEKASLILVMEKNHLKYLSNYSEKSFLLTEFVGDEAEDVLDPYYDGQIDQIYNQLNSLVEKMIELFH